MAEGAWRVVAAVVILAHGVGHGLGVMPLFGLTLGGAWHNRSWLLGEGLAEPVARWVAPVLWVLALAAFVAVGLGLLGIGVQGMPWRWLVLVAAMASALAVVVFWNGFPTMVNRLGALAVDAALVWWVLRLPAAAFAAS